MKDTNKPYISVITLASQYSKIDLTLFGKLTACASLVSENNDFSSIMMRWVDGQ
jgi:hypothetical protein